MIRRFPPAAAFWCCVITAFLTSSLARADDAKSFVVHEWGTFSTFSGADGVPLKFTPNDTDLPKFVHNRHSYVKGGLSDVLVSLETPVLYFYTDRDRTVSVRADFPKGMMTDWYPAASRPPTQQLRWDNLRILATDRPTLPDERGVGRYFAAREVDAATVKATDAEGKQQVEKFVFYRGVGDATMPVTVKGLGNGKFVVKNSGKQPLSGHFLVEVRNHQMTLKSLGKLAAGTEETVERSADPISIETVQDTLARALVEQGLYEKEAQAMVKTWTRDWFGDEGTRVLYFVAESLTAELLPLTIEPKPDRLVRVLVGRHDVLTPERERKIDDLVKQLQGDSNSASRSADKALNVLGRYRAAAQKAAEMRLAVTSR